MLGHDVLRLNFGYRVGNLIIAFRFWVLRLDFGYCV